MSFLLAFAAVMAAQTSDAHPSPQAGEKVGYSGVFQSFAGLPLSFEPNQGQAAGGVRFLTRGPGYTLLLKADEAMLALRQPSAKSPAGTPDQLRIELRGANPAPVMEALEQLPGRSSYFVGNDPKRWRTGIPNYARVRYRQVYPGVDLVYYGKQGRLEYDFVVGPRRDVGVVELDFQGAEKVQLNAAGELLIQAGGSTVRMPKPDIYQEIGGKRREVRGGYVLRGRKRVGFRAGRYDRRQALVIDPQVVFMTFLGSTDWEYGYGVAVDSAHNVYIAGTAASYMSVPQVAGSFRAGMYSGTFVIKLNSDGSAAQYAAFLAGATWNGPSASGIAVNAAGEAYITGTTRTTDFPVVNAAQNTNAGGDDGFLAKLSADGTSLVFSTYVGGKGADEIHGVALDGSGNAYIVGKTTSLDLAAGNAANGGGVYLTNDAPTGWTRKVTGLGGGDIAAIAFAVDGWAWVGTNGGGLYRGVPASGVDWTKITSLADPWIRDVATSPLDGNTVYVATSESPGMYRTTDGGSSWTACGTPPGYGAWGARLVINPVSPSTIYFLNYDHVYKSTDSCASWGDASAGLPVYVENSVYPWFTSLAIDPTNSNVLYLGDGNNNGLYRSANGGQSWSLVGLINTPVLSLLVQNTSTVIIGSYGMQVWKTTDGGSTWTNLSAGVVGGDVVQMTVSNGVLYAGTKRGWTAGGGILQYYLSAWTRVDTGLVTKSVAVLAADPTRPGSLLAGFPLNDVLAAKYTSSGALGWMKYFGGTEQDYGNGIAVSGSGVYLIGDTMSPDLPVTATTAPMNTLRGMQNAFVSQLEAGTGNVVTSAFLGGSGFDYGNAITVRDGYPWAGGEACSSNFAVTAGAFQTTSTSMCRGFVTQLASSGDEVLASTFLGGDTGQTMVLALATDSAGYVYAGGQTYATDFPLQNAPISWYPPYTGLYDPGAGFLTQLTASLSQIGFSTYLGGGGQVNSIATDANSDVYVAGTTQTNDIPVVSMNVVQPGFGGAADAFVGKFHYTGYNADVGISITAPGTAVTGSTASFSIPVTNYTTGVDAHNVVVKLFFEGALEITSVDRSECAIYGTHITCTFPTLSTSVGIGVSLVPLLSGRIDSMAHVYSADTDTNPSNNNANAAVSVMPAYNMSLALTHTPASAVRGQLVPQTITVTNNWDAITNVSVTYTYPVEGNVMAPTLSQGSCGLVIGHLDCSLGDLDHGHTATISIPIALPNAGDFGVSAAVTSVELPTPQTVTDTLHITSGANASAAVTTAAPYALLDQNFTFRATVTNAGPDGDTVGANIWASPTMSVVSATPSAGSCSGTAPITCTFGALGVGASATVDVVVTPNMPGSFTSMAIATTALTDPDPTNDIGTVTVEVKPTAQSAELYLVSDRFAQLYVSDPTWAHADTAKYLRSGAYPGAAVVAPNGRTAFVPSATASYTAVIDLALQTEVARISVPTLALALYANGTRLAGLGASDNLVIIDTSNYAVVQQIDLTPAMSGLGAAPGSYVDPGSLVVARNRAYINTYGYDAGSCSATTMTGCAYFGVVVVDLDTQAVSVLPNSGLEGYGGPIAATGNGRYVIAERYTPSGTGDSVLLIDTNANNFTTVDLPSGYGGTVVATPDAYDPDGVFAYVIGDAINTLDLRSGSSTFGQFLNAAALPFGAMSGAISADGNKIFVAGGPGTPNLAILDTAVLRSPIAGSPVLSSYQVSPYPYGIATGYVDTNVPAGAPTVNTVAPSWVMNDIGGQVKISGSNFAPDATVKVGSLTGLPVTHVSSSELRVTVPAGAPVQEAKVVVTNPNASGARVDRNQSGYGVDNALMIDSPLAYQPVHPLAALLDASGTLGEIGRSDPYHLYFAGFTGTSMALSSDGSRAYISSLPVGVSGFGISVVSAQFPSRYHSESGTVETTLQMPRSATWLERSVNPATGRPVLWAAYTYVAAGGITDPRLVMFDIDPTSATFHQQIGSVTPSYNGARATRFTVTPDGRWAYMWLSAPGKLGIFDLANKTLATANISLYTTLLSVTPDGRSLIALLPNNTVGVFDIQANPAAPSLVTALSGTPPSGMTAFTMTGFGVSANRIFAYDGVQGALVTFNYDRTANNFAQLGVYRPEHLGGVVPSLDGSVLYMNAATYDTVYVLDVAKLSANDPNPVITSVLAPAYPTRLQVSPGLLAGTDMAMSVTGPAGTVAPNQTVTYTFTVRNNGPADTYGVGLKTAIPAGATLVSAVVSGANNSCSTFGDITCVFKYGIPASGYETVTVTLVAPSTAGAATVTAGVGSDLVDGNLANNYVTWGPQVGLVDLAVIREAAVHVGGNQQQHTVTVLNGGPSMAHNVMLTDRLEGYTYVAANTTQGSCSLLGGEVKCALGTLDVSSTATITVTVQPPTSGWGAHTFSVVGDEPDSNPTNNSVRVSGPLDPYNTLAGSNITVAADPLLAVTVTFASVSSAGTTTASAIDPQVAPAAFRNGFTPQAYELSTSATFAGAITVSVAYNPANYRKPARVRLFHLENGVWVDRTVTVDTVNHRIYASLPSLSKVAVFEPENRAPVAVAGGDRVVPASGAQGAVVKLDGSASADADGDTLSYRWSGPFAGTTSGANPSLSLPVGKSAVTLVVNDGEVDSAPATANVTVSDFALSLGQSTASVRRDQPAVLTINVSPQFGEFAAAVTLACGELPAGTTCTFSPATVTPGAKGTASTLTITTSAMAGLQRRTHLAWLAMLAPFGLLLAGGKRRVRWLLLALVVVALIAGFGCGGGSAPTQNVSRGTTVTLTVTGSAGGLQHSANTSVTIYQ
jgi:uncharacterized repeat protein (TIGR01451 family)